MTYYIRTKKDPGEGRDVILIHSVIKTCRKNIGQATEYINDNPDLANFYLTPPSVKTPNPIEHDDTKSGESDAPHEHNETDIELPPRVTIVRPYTPDPDDSLPPEEQGTIDLELLDEL